MSKDEKTSQAQRYPCPECHTGNMTLQHVVYYTWVNGELITVPDFPAWVCDMCGMREYDQRALSWLNI
ncbi:MAG TPA: YgiT-type zinc finger protein, partial [Anaerolineales bacterium]|nr:YgiT-type zinc finger protein [Anaerolineales bacterium]